MRSTPCSLLVFEKGEQPMMIFPQKPMSRSNELDISWVFLAAEGLFYQGLEIERYRDHGSGKGWHDLIDSSYGYTKCCEKKFSNDLALLRHRRSVEHGVGLAAKVVYGTSPYGPPGEWRYFTPNYLRFANYELIGLAKKIARFAGKIPAPVIPEGKLSDSEFRSKLAMDLAKAYIARSASREACPTLHD
jgi:hypothetical protein